MENEQLEQITKRLDKLSNQLEVLVVISSKPEPFIRKVVDLIAAGVTILGIIGVIETFKIWIGG